jgi:hypothetical protein
MGRGDDGIESGKSRDGSRSNGRRSARWEVGLGDTRLCATITVGEWDGMRRNRNQRITLCTYAVTKYCMFGHRMRSKYRLLFFLTVQSYWRLVLLMFW